MGIFWWYFLINLIFHRLHTLIPLLGKVLFGSISIPFNLAFWFGLLIDLTNFITEKLPFKIGLFCLIKVDAQYDFNFNETIWFSSLDDVFPVRRYLKFETLMGNTMRTNLPKLLVLNFWRTWDQESPKQRGKNGPSLSCSKASAWTSKEEMPCV